MLIVMAAWASPISPAMAQAVSVKVQGTIAGTGGPIKVELSIDRQDRATLRATHPAPTGVQVEQIKLLTIDTVVPLLIDRRLAFLWPALIEWGGPALDRLRSRMLEDSAKAFARGKPAYGSSFAPEMRSKASAYYERAHLLTLAGSRGQAIDLLRRATDEWSTGKSWGHTEQGLLLSELAGLLFGDGRPEEADILLSNAITQLGDRSASLNVLINRAALLASGGRYAEALDVIDPASERYSAYKETIGGWLTAVPGTQRYFAAIRACALAGLGRRTEAREALAPALIDREPNSLVFKVFETNSEVRLRAYVCMRDHEAFVQEIVANIAGDPIAPAALGLMQPAIKAQTFDPAFVAAARADQRVVAALRDIARPLPPELVPALNNWRD